MQRLLFLSALACLLVLTSCDDRATYKNITTDKLTGRWALVEETSEWISEFTGEKMSEHYTYETVGSPLVWEIGEEAISGRNFEMPVHVGPYRLEEYKGDYYILLEDNTPEQFGDTYGVFKILSLSNTRLQIVSDSRNADGTKHTMLFERHE